MTLRPLVAATDWKLVGEKTFTPDDSNEAIGNFSLELEQDTLWVRITQLSEYGTMPWSYGILSWRSSDGYELGSVKAYGQTQSEVFRLGVGLSPSDRNGVITFNPRSFNLHWVREGWPWSLRFEALSGTASEGTPAFGTKATLMVPAVPSGNAQADFSIEGEVARLLLNLVFRK